jgi:SM-20-related protein
MLAQDIRTDQTFWLNGKSPAQGEILSLMDDLRQQLNRELFLGLSSYEAHFARYQAGGFYKKHLDSFKGQRNRIVSTVLYLTPDWQESDGGHLVIYDPVDQEKEVVRVLPRVGTLACFISEDMPHEVLPPARERVSIAGWFRANSSDILNP